MCDKEICGILLRDTGYGIRDTGYGIRERVSHIAGYGTRDTGYGMRDTEWKRHGPGLAYGIRAGKEGYGLAYGIRDPVQVGKYRARAQGWANAFV